MDIVGHKAKEHQAKILAQIETTARAGLFSRQEEISFLSSLLRAYHRELTSKEQGELFRLLGETAASGRLRVVTLAAEDAGWRRHVQLSLFDET